MANYEATKYDFTWANLTNVDLVNTGLIIPWSDSSIPSGFLECNGQAVSRTTYSALFAVIGTTYGSGNGSTTFNLPDLQDDNAMGKSPTKALASTGGADTVTATGNLSVTVGNTSLSTPTIVSQSRSWCLCAPPPPVLPLVLFVGWGVDWLLKLPGGVRPPPLLFLSLTVWLCEAIVGVD